MFSTIYKSSTICSTHVQGLMLKGLRWDWTVNDGLYHRFLKWKPKCENILNCELAMLPESKKCKKVMALSGDFGMDQYVPWCLPMEDLWLDTIWAKYEDFCKPQANEVRARSGLLTSFRQGNITVDEWYNAVQAQVSLGNYPPEQQLSCLEIYFGSSWDMKSLLPNHKW